MAKLDLDVDAPRKVANVLRSASDRFAEDAERISADWQDRMAGRPWRMIARKLDAVAESIEKELRKMGY